jgi:hypothetical protein
VIKNSNKISRSISLFSIDKQMAKFSYCDGHSINVHFQEDRTMATGVS